MRLLRDLGCCRAAGADRPHRLVRDDEVLVLLEDGDLPPEHGFCLLALALLLELADAGDHEHAGLEGGGRAPRDRLVGLAEALPSLGVADDRAVHAELFQHRRGDLAGVRAVRIPVHVLRRDSDFRPGE